MKKIPFMFPEYKLWWLIVQTTRALHKARVRELQQYGITVPESAVLVVVRALGNRVTPTEISRWLSREPHSVGYLLARMEKKGLVKRVRNLDRRNLVGVTITKKGQQAYNQVLKSESIRQIMVATSQDECQKLAECLEKLHDTALNKLGTRYKPPYPPTPR